MTLPITGMTAITPALNCKTVTPHDSTNFTFGICKGIRVGTGGDVAVVMFGDGDTGSVTVIPDVLAGETLPVQAIRVNSTGTTATGLTAYY